MINNKIKKQEDESLLQYRARLYSQKVSLGMSNKDIYKLYIEETGDTIAESSARCSAIQYLQGISDYKKSNIEFENSVMIINDIHCPHEREDVLTIIEKHSTEITALVVGGDLMDCFAVSSFPKIEAMSLIEELKYTYNFLKKIRAILSDGQDIIIINGNHEERWRKVIEKMHEKDLQKFINPNILSMMIEGFVIYDDKKRIKFEPIEGIKYVPHWYVVIDRMVVCHPKTFSVSKGKMLENVTQHFVNKGIDFDLVVFGHTHKLSTGIIDRYCNKIAVENPCLCKPQPYADRGSTGYSAQTYGYTVVQYNKGESISYNNIKTYSLEEITDTTSEYTLTLGDD